MRNVKTYVLKYNVLLHSLLLQQLFHSFTLSASLSHSSSFPKSFPCICTHTHTHNSIWVARHVAVDSAQIMFRTAVYFTCHFSSVSIYSTRLHATRQFTSIVPFLFSNCSPTPGFSVTQFLFEQYFSFCRMFLNWMTFNERRLLKLNGKIRI